MSFDQQIDKVNQTKNPTPTKDNEHYEYNNVQRALRSQHNRKSDENFYNPTNEGDEQE